MTVVASDMRTWAAPEPADLLVSELLGSFGDNELSPECLDGVQRFLRSGADADAERGCRWWRGPGVSIPSEYTSFLAPVQCPGLWHQARSFDHTNVVKWMETAYVVRMGACVQLGPPVPAFTFEHPNPALPVDNARVTRARWTAASAGVVHGFAGYFDATLFGAAASRISISINPPTHSSGMFSWFPLYFPLREAVTVAAGDPIEAHVARCAADGRVWYEWALTRPRVGALHNPGGRSHSMGL